MMLKLGYIGLTIAVCVLLIHFGFTAIDKTFNEESRKRKKTILISGLVLWQVYIFFVAASGFIQTFSFPPRFALSMIIPSFIFIGMFVYQNRDKSWIMNISPNWLFFFQSFRILVELLFVGSVAAGLLHNEASIEGYNFDMVYAFTILIVGYFVFVKQAAGLRLIRAWNYLGLLVLASIIFVFMSTIYKPELYGATEPMLPIDGLTYPYVLVAGFLMPVAVFIHVLSITQLNRLIKK